MSLKAAAVLSLLAVTLASSRGEAQAGLTLHPLIGSFDPGGFYWGFGVRYHSGLSASTLVFRHNDLRGDEWRLTYQQPLGGAWAFRLDLGLNEKRDAYDIDRLPEATVLLLPLRLAATPVQFSLEVGAADLFERQLGGRTGRGRALVTLSTDPVRLGPLPVDLAWTMGSSWYTTAPPQRFRTFTIGSTVPLSLSATFRVAYARRWVDGTSPLGFDRLDPLNEIGGTLSIRIGGDVSASATVVYGFFVQDVKTRDYALTYAPAGGAPISLIWHDVTQRVEIQIQQGL